MTTRALTDTAAWANSQAVDGDISDAVKREQRDVIVMGSLSLVHMLMVNDLIDEYRLLTFPTILGAGERLFPADSPPADLELVLAAQIGATVLSQHRRAARSPTGRRHAHRPEGGTLTTEGGALTARSLARARRQPIPARSAGSRPGRAHDQLTALPARAE